MENNSTHSPSIKEKILEAAISLIQQSDGLPENITVRDIASKAGVAVGLINYHFGSKKKLIEACVQRMISEVMKDFFKTQEEKHTAQGAEYNRSDFSVSTVSVFSYLVSHPEISKISMLSDFSDPALSSNSAASYKAIYGSIKGDENEDVKKVKAFMLLATMQSAFLNRGVSKELLGFDLNSKEDFSRFFQCAVKLLNL